MTAQIDAARSQRLDRAAASRVGARSELPEAPSGACLLELFEQQRTIGCGGTGAA
jgi:hypothetical protein